MAISLYRAVEKYPPGPKDYRTYAQQGRPLPENPTPEEIESMHALSGWETEAAALAFAKRKRSAKWVVRYDIPEDCGVVCKPSGPKGHYDIYGDPDALHRCLAEGSQAPVPRP